MGYCQYRYNPSEQYQRTAPGCAPESHCGARTYPMQDEPEIVPVTEYVDGQPVGRMAFSGRYVNREHDDPHCPAHGGSPAPPAPVITLAQVLEARSRLLELCQQFDQAGELRQALPGLADLVETTPEMAAIETAKEPA